MSFARRSFVRSSRRLQRLDQSPLRTRPKVRVLVRALLGAVTELRLHGLDRSAARDRLARHRVPPHLVMAERSKAELALHELEGPDVAVDVAGGGAGACAAGVGGAGGVG